MTAIEADVRHIVVCYPTESLSSQVARWGREHDDCRIEPTFARNVWDIRRSYEGADIVVVDATEDHAQAIDAFSQSVARLGSGRTLVYTERMHDGLELFVRTQGSWLLLGPLDEVQWDELFTTMLTAIPEGQTRVHRRRAA